MTADQPRRRSAGSGVGFRPGASHRAAAIAITAVTAAVIIALDLWSKQWAETTLTPGVSRPFIGELLQLHLIYNSGAAWSLGSGITPVITAVQILICLAAIVGVVWKVRDWRWALAFGLLVGGALGNIHDRLLRAPGPMYGEVVDFLRLPYWPIFNVADMGVVAAAILIVLLTFLGVPADLARPHGADADAADADRSTNQAGTADASAPGSSAVPKERA